MPLRTAGTQATEAITVADRTNATHIPALDGLRGVAIILVLFWHLLPSSVFGDRIVLVPLKLIREMGWTGVDLFFVLSGFLITTILLRNKGSKTYFRAFYARRILRIFPLYYLLLAICIFILPEIAYLEKYEFFWRDEGNPIWYWLYLANFRYGLDVPEHQFLGVTWSLSIEEQYYVVWPLVVWLFRWRTLVYIEIGLILMSVLLRFYFVEFSGYSYKFSYFFTLTHLDGLAIGGLLALGLHRATECEKALNIFGRLLPLWLLLWVAIAAYSQNFGTSRYATYDPTMLKYGYLVTALFFGSLLLNCIRGPNWIGRCFDLAPLRSVGKYSFAMYLLHWPCTVLVNEVLAVTAPPLGQGTVQTLLIFCIYFAVTYAVAYLVWIAFEGPINRQKRHFQF